MYLKFDPDNNLIFDSREEAFEQYPNLSTNGHPKPVIYEGRSYHLIGWVESSYSPENKWMAKRDNTTVHPLFHKKLLYIWYADKEHPKQDLPSKLFQTSVFNHQEALDTSSFNELSPDENPDEIDRTPAASDRELSSSSSEEIFMLEDLNVENYI